MSLVDVPSEALFATAAAQPHDPGFVPFVRRAAGGRDPGRDRVGRVRVLHRTRARGARGGGAAGRHRADDVRGPARPDRVSRTATRPASCAGPASATGSSPTRRPGAPSCSSATARATATPRATRDIVWAKRSLVRICLEAGWAFRRWTEFREIETWLDGDPGRLARGSGDAARAASDARSSAARRCGARAAWIRRPDAWPPAVLAPVRPSARSPRTAPSRA